MKRLSATWLSALSLFLLVISGGAHASMTRYSLNNYPLSGYFDYDTSTASLGAFDIWHGLYRGNTDPIHPEYLSPATTISVATPTEIDFLKTFSMYDSTYRYEWTLDFRATFFNPGPVGSYDGYYGYGETLNEYRLSDGSLALSGISPFGGSFGFISVGPAPVPVPGAAWLLGSGLIGLVGIARKRKAA